MQAIGPPQRPGDIEAPLQELPRARSLGNGTQVWFVRHAEVAAKYHDMAYGSMDVELSEAGVGQTEAMARAFEGIEVHRILSSDLVRARSLGEGIARATGSPIQTTELLREMNRGDWQGLSKTEFVQNWTRDARNYWNDPYHWHTPAGEGDSLLFERAYPLLSATLEGMKGETLVVTAHGQLIRVLISRFLGFQVPESYAYYLDPAHATRLVDSPSGWELVDRNLSPEQVGV